MKRIWVVIVNVFLILSMLTFVIIYSTFETNNARQRQIEHFENTTVTMQHITENYLEGEQRICDVWTHYINSEGMNIDEAISFIRISHVLPNASAHIVYTDTLTGYSTKPKQGTADEYDVSYKNINLLNDTSWISEIGTSINVTRAYTNPINGEQSIAFCNFVSLKEGGESKKAVLLRVLPVAELETKWVFPKEEYESAELSIIDINGDYIIKGNSFKNSSFFEFYRSYNEIDSSSSQEFFKKITSTTGSFFMLVNSRNKQCIVAHTPFNATGDWTLISLMPIEDLAATTQNWLLIGVISSGLLILLIFDLLVMHYFNKKLEASAKEADSANKAKTDFLSTMSHDIRTPMNAITGLSLIAEKNVNDQKLVSENLHKINLASNHLLTLINDILDISKVESGKLTLSPQSFSLVDMVENLMNLSQPMIKEKNINFAFHFSRMDKEFIFADQLRLNQICINILTNAIKYTEEGGSVTVDMKEDNSEKEGCVRLIYKVKDTGIGMSPEYMEKMYQPFTRQTDSRVNKIEGTGLGLTITKQMVDLMEGDIQCESEQGKGTTFTVTLDIPVSTEPQVEMKLEKHNVLVVDNDDIDLENTKDVLESLGLNVETTKSDKHYDIVVASDIESLRQISSEVDAPITLLIAYSGLEKEAKKAGINGILNKPLFRSVAYQKINEALGKEVKAIEPENDYSNLKGMNILIAEDNDINWEIISTLLSMYDITSNRAENGLICAEKMKQAKKGEYDLIFMDIQMPEMNGLDATRAIRALDDKWASSIPIVAMTADAFSENVSECLEAGMNGHIAKPIDINVVIKVIQKIKEESK